LQIHELHGEVDLLRGRIRGRGREDVLFAKDRRLALDERGAVRASPFRITAVPMMIRSFGFNSTLRAILVLLA
jgi:hypothetical protein